MCADKPRKRPMGLKARAQAKKQKTDAAITEGGAEAVNDFDDEKTATIMLKNDSEDASELDELEGILDAALDALADPARALVLLRGSIHECDRILRVHDEQPDADTEPLGARFYRIYGTALFTISELAQPTDSKEYLELAQSRLETADSMAADDDSWRACMNLGKVVLTRLSRSEIDGSEADACSRALGCLDKAIRLLAKQASPAASLDAETVAMAGLVVALADTRTLSPAATSALIEWAESKLAGIKEQSEESKVIRARVLWIRAGEILDQQDEETGEVPDQQTLDELLTKAAGILDACSSGDALLLLGEIQLNAGNIQDDEAKQDEMYGLAVEAFNGAKKVGALPEQFEQFIKDFSS